MFGIAQFANRSTLRAFSLVLAFVLLANPSLLADKKKKKDAAAPTPEQESVLKKLDYSKIVWPNPPAITRVKYLDYFAGEEPKPEAQTQKKKAAWMDRLAGADPTATDKKGSRPLFALWTPYGLAVDSKGSLYVADGRVGAIFIFNTQTRDVEMIKNGTHARFGLIMGLAMDDGDRLFVSDSQLHRVLVFGKDRKLEGTISEGLVDPGGMAIDNENRFLYVADAALDQVFVYDADKFTLIRRMGITGKNHTLTEPGQFARPTNVAVDADGNLYVSDTSNRRVEIFDADGEFIRTWGKAGDGPGKFARPKGIAIDADGHVWVADAVQDRVQVFTPEGKVLMYLGGHGLLPGQFGDLAGLTIDKKNRVFTSEQYPGRVQMFQYITNPEARAEYDRRQADEKRSTGAAATASQAPASSEQKPKQEGSAPRN